VTSKKLFTSQLNTPLGEGEVSPFFRRDGGGFRRSAKEYRDKRCGRRSPAVVIFSIY
jgi:hypothetical protein